MKLCPRCHVLVNEAIAPPGGTQQPPAPGDYTVCGACGTLLQFGPAMELQLIPKGQSVLTRPGDIARAQRQADLDARHRRHVDDLLHAAWLGAKKGR